MKKEPVIAIVGATGLVGSEMGRIITELNIPSSEVRLLASQDSIGEIYQIKGEELEVALLDQDSFHGVDIALFATSADLSQKFVPIAVAAGAVAIDNSSFFRMDPDVPLVVPEVNSQAIGEAKIIANPNCSTIQLVPVLKAIGDFAGLKRVVVSSYQSVSGAGKAALDELWGQTLAIFNQSDFTPEAFQHQIAFNCIPQIDVLLDDGYTKEEYKIINESRKILDLPALMITATAVRVPVFHSHAESVNVEVERDVGVDDVIAFLSKCEGIEVYPNYSDYPLQIDTTNTDKIHVGRIRRDNSVPYGFNLWIVADNLRKGAALNAIQIAQRLIGRE